METRWGRRKPWVLAGSLFCAVAILFLFSPPSTAGIGYYTLFCFAFYVGYALSCGRLLCLDLGHFHPTESVADKVKAIEDKFDLDFHLDDAEKPAPLQAKAEPVLAAAPAAPAADKLARPAAALELDKLDLSFDPDKATFEDPTPSVLDGQWHDAATKLDLAKAYQEMGDVEGAREILQEVLHEGDDEQKKEAQAIIAKLG